MDVGFYSIHSRLLGSESRTFCHQKASINSVRRVPIVTMDAGIEVLTLSPRSQVRGGASVDERPDCKRPIWHHQALSVGEAMVRTDWSLTDA